MKKVYEAPQMEMERFLIADILTVSGNDNGGIGTGDGVSDPWAD